MDYKDIEIDDNLPIDKDVVKQAKDKIAGLGKDLSFYQQKQMEILKESAENGGPSSNNEAIMNLMDYCKVGIRQLSVKVGVPRKKLLRMIHGQAEMPPEIFQKIVTVFETIRPDLFKDIGF